MKEQLKIYLKENYQIDNGFFGNVMRKESRKAIFEDYECASVQTYIDDNKNESLFQTLLFKYIDERNLKDSDVYNKVNIDRRLFSKIRSDKNYHPSKETIILLGLSLELNESEIINLLESASYSLPKNNYFVLKSRTGFPFEIFLRKNV